MTLQAVSRIFDSTSFLLLSPTPLIKRSYATARIQDGKSGMPMHTGHPLLLVLSGNSE